MLKVSARFLIFFIIFVVSTYCVGALFLCIQGTWPVYVVERVILDKTDEAIVVCENNLYSFKFLALKGTLQNW